MDSASPNALSARPIRKRSQRQTTPTTRLPAWTQPPKKHLSEVLALRLGLLSLNHSEASAAKAESGDSAGADDEANDNLQTSQRFAEAEPTQTGGLADPSPREVFDRVPIYRTASSRYHAKRFLRPHYADSQSHSCRWLVPYKSVQSFVKEVYWDEEEKWAEAEKWV
jgi:hypothetical protein